MADSLLVKISKGSTPFTLRAARITHAFDRSVSPNALPSGTAGTAGQTFYLDLGQCIESITVEGLVDVAHNASNAENALKSDLEVAIRTWYVQYSLGGGTDGGTPALLEFPGGSRSVFFKGASFTMEGGLEDRWSFNIHFLVAN